VLRRTRPRLERPYMTLGLSAGADRVPRGGAVRLGELPGSETLKFAVDIGIIATGVPVYLAIRVISAARRRPRFQSAITSRAQHAAPLLVSSDRPSGRPTVLYQLNM